MHRDDDRGLTLAEQEVGRRILEGEDESEVLAAHRASMARVWANLFE